MINLQEIIVTATPPSARLSRRAAMRMLAVVLVALLVSLLAVRVLDGRRDQHDKTLLSLVHLSDLLGRDGTDTFALEAAPTRSVEVAADLRYTRQQISERLVYLGRLGLARSKVRLLQQAMTRYQAEADQAVGASDRAPVPALAAQVASLRSTIQTYSDHERSVFATYDQALDSATVVILAVASGATLLGAIGINRRTKR